MSTISLRLSESLRAQARALAEQEGISIKRRGPRAVLARRFSAC